MKRQRAFLDDPVNPSPFKKRTLLLASSRGTPLNATQKRQVIRAIKSKEELKFFDTVLSNASINLAGRTDVLTLIPQGVTDITRVGDYATLEDLELRFFFGTGDSTNELRIVLWQYFENTILQTPGSVVILEDGAAGVANTPEVNSQYQLPRKPNSYKILKDWTIDLSDQARPNGHFVYKHKFDVRKKINFNQAVTTGYNHVCLTILSDSAAAPNPSVTYTSRIRFTDA